MTRKHLYQTFLITLIVYLVAVYFTNKYTVTEFSLPSKEGIHIANLSDYDKFLSYKDKNHNVGLLSAILIYSQNIDFIENVVLFYKEQPETISDAIRVFAVHLVTTEKANCSLNSLKIRDAKIALLKKMKVYNKLDLFFFINKDKLNFFVSFIFPLIVFTIVYMLQKVRVKKRKV